MLIFAWLFFRIQTMPLFSQPVDEGEAAPETAVTDGREAERSIVFGDSPAADTPDTAQGGPTVWTVVKIILTLALCAAAVYGVVFFVKKASKKKYENKDPFLRVLASVNLGLNRYAHIISVGSKAYLVGASDGGVNLISNVEDADIINAMLLEDSQKSANENTGRLNDFVSILRRLGLPVKQGGQSAENIRKHRERLKGL